jgi:HemX.
VSKEFEDTQTATDADIEPEVPETSETAASSEADVQVSDQTPTSEGRWLPMLLAGLAMFATAGVGWFGWTEFARLEQQIQSLAQQVESVSGIQTQLAATDNRLQGLTDELSRLGGEIQRSDARNQAVIDRVESVADALARAQVDTRTSYTLAEAEYLLKIADQRLW